MKKILLTFAAIFFCAALFAYESSDIDFTIKPKTHFSQGASGAGKSGLAEQDKTAVKNKTEVALPDQKLLRGFERFPKVDAFGDALPDSFLFYRKNLSSSQKSAYDEIYKALMNANPALDLITRVHNEELATVMEAVYYDNPELFWWAGGYSYCYNSISGLVTQIEFKLLFSERDLPIANKIFFNMSMPIIFYANLLDNDMDKIKYVHDYLCLSIDYDIEAFNSGNYGGKLQTAYSAVVDYKTVCAGYSRAFAYYMQQLRIPCSVLSGSGHAWNMVQVGGECYQIDVTWDDGAQVPVYFNLPHAQMQKVESHAPGPNAASVILANPTRSERFKYENYFGKAPIGRPYTYRELSRIKEDVENPAFAQVAKEQGQGGQSSMLALKQIDLLGSMLDANGNPVSKLRPNDIVKFKVLADADCYLAILSIDANGAKAWIPMNNNFLEAGKQRVFPDLSGRVLRIADDGVFGKEHVIIYACSNKEGLPSKAASGKYSNEDLHAIMRRQQAARKSPDQAFGVAKITYEIVGK